MQRGPLVLSAADRRFQSNEGRVEAMSAAVPEADRRLPEDWKYMSTVDQST
jgi:hypothetical protein